MQAKDISRNLARGKAVSTGEDGAVISSLFTRITEVLHRLSGAWLVTFGLFMILLAGVTHDLAGPELSGWMFYFIPVLLVAWFAGRWSGLTISFASAAVWFIVDLHSGMTYSNPAIPYWNGTARLGSFIILVYVLSAVRSVLNHEQEVSRIDHLTGIGNRRYFMELAALEIHRARRYQHPFTVAWIDLDNFKWVNDRFGHSTGDHVLRSVAHTIRRNLRVTDAVARLGGDEFAVLLPQTGPEQASAVTGKLREINTEITEKHGVTFSIGVVTFTRPPSGLDEILRVSDGLMYTAKNHGKNSLEYRVLGKEEYCAVTVA